MDLYKNYVPEETFSPPTFREEYLFVSTLRELESHISNTVRAVMFDKNTTTDAQALLFDASTRDLEQSWDSVQDNGWLIVEPSSDTMNTLVTLSQFPSSVYEGVIFLKDIPYWIWKKS